MAIKKLIEVALPLEKINAESEHEKSVRHNHPSNIHQWWARRPFSTARAVIWASLIDDPSSHPELFPTEEDQKKERLRLFHILEELVVWENSNDTRVLNAAKAEIIRYTNGNPPELLDPFSGGGAIPFEATRLGLKAHAHDLNPVAVAINKAMIEIAPQFSGVSPVNPEASRMLEGSWDGVTGLANDIMYYGSWMRDRAFEKVGSNYPKMHIPPKQGGGETNVISWLWARTVKCPNPACGCKMPMASSYVLSKKKGGEVWAEPIVLDGRIDFIIHYGPCPKGKDTDKQGRSAIFKCPACGEITTDDYVKTQGKQGKLGYQLMAVVGEGNKGRIYTAPSIEHELAAQIPMPEDYPSGSMPENPRWFSPPAFGMTEYSDLFTNRQLTTLMTFSKLVSETQVQVEKDAVEAGFANDHVGLAAGGTGARAYGEAIGVHLAFLVDKMTCLHSNLTVWKPLAQCPLTFFGRQAIPMSWDFAEANPFSNSSGSFGVMLEGYVSAFANAFQMQYDNVGEVIQADAQSDCGLRNIMISTDPPYYDNIGYADLSDFFYVWLRQCLKDTYPEIFRTLLVPKAEELVATPYRFGGSTQKAKDFFEDGMLSTCRQLYKYASDDIPVTIYYAYKQTDSKGEDASSLKTSSGWETMLSSIIKAGFTITGTWPMRTERTGRMISNGTNALASSIVLVCRKRSESAPQTTRRNLVSALRRELRPALKKLQESNIAPVDLAQSAIGPGMAAFSQYKKVLEADGSEMSVRSALQVINEEIDLYFNEQVGSMDTASRFCVDLYTQCAYNDIKYGEAEVLANAKGTSIPMMASHGVLYAKAGLLHLVERDEMPDKVDTNESNIWMLTQQLTRAMAKGGVNSCAEIVFNMFGSNAESAKDLAYRLYTIAERKGWTEEAYAYNNLVVAWPDIQTRAAELKAVQPEQLNMFDLGLLNQ